MKMKEIIENNDKITTIFDRYENMMVFLNMMSVANPAVARPMYPPREKERKSAIRITPTAAIKRYLSEDRFSRHARATAKGRLIPI